MPPKRRQYSRITVDAAIKYLQETGESTRNVSKKFGIPRSTLQFKIKNPHTKDKCGPNTILTETEENLIVSWIINLAKKGFPRNIDGIVSSVQDFLTDVPRPNPFKNNRPGDGWVKLFLRRHPILASRTSEGVSYASACITENDIKKWFREIRNYITDENLSDVINDPSRVLNGDETGFQICPSTGKVLAEKGTKNVYAIEKSSPKENITVMFTFSADGTAFNPMVVFPYQRIPERLIQSVPSTWGIGKSDNGWMTSMVFYEYVANVLHPELVKKGVKFPIIFFVDGHKSHLTYNLSQLCANLQIHLIALYPNATRILQPADVAVFKPIKAAWKKAVRDFYTENPGKVLTKFSFALVLKRVLETAVQKETLVNGFKACGLYPFDDSAIDYTKCLGGKKTSEDNCIEKNTKSMSIGEFKNIVGPELVQKFKQIDKIMCDERNKEEFYVLFRLWQHFNEPLSDETAVLDSSQNICIEDVPILSINDENDIPGSAQNISREQGLLCHSPRVAENREVFMGQEDIPIPTITQMTSHTPFLSQIIEPQPSTSAQPLTTSFENYLSYPDSPKRKGKRNIERMPYAISSEKYRRIFEERKRIKDDILIAKERKKKERLEQKFKNKRITGKENKTKNNSELESYCHICKIKAPKELYCSECKNIYHKTCIPKRHKIHIPVNLKDDSFLCHLCFAIDTDGSSNHDEDDSELIDELYNNYKNMNKKNMN